VDVEILTAWMDEQGLERGPVEKVEPIGGGTQNVMLRFVRNGREFVLRRGPEHLRRRSNDSMRREMQVLAALSTTEVPHPQLIASCPDETVMGGAAFYLMEPIDGFNASVELPDPHAHSSEIRHRMGLAMVDALATLGSVDYVAVGLGEIGRPAGFLERQVPRWLRELDSYAELAGYPGPDIPGVQAVADWLERNRPQDWTPGVLHGDFHIANVMFSRTGPEVAAIVDWEMCTIGDPLLDLGWLLALWPESESDSDQTVLARAGGLPTHEELVARYAERSQRDLSAIDWYVVLACFKLGIVLEGTYARAHAGLAPKDIGDRLHSVTLALFKRAGKLIAR
jgi:aminoglycoside phosphotransferase (APT) family kinase protein